MTQPIAIVTGASSGIGAASARALAKAGYYVVAAARRRDRIENLAADIGGIAVTLDVTSDSSVAALAETVAALDGPVTVLVNNAGVAVGRDPVAEANPEDWRHMYDVNVIGMVRMTKALLPALVESGDGQLVLIGSTAGRMAYEGGGGYAATKFAVAALRDTLRLELLGQPIRVVEIAPGMVATEEFSLVRFGGDAEKAAAVYAGVTPLVAEDVAEAVVWCVTRPAHVNVDLLVVRPRDQATQYKTHRESS